MDKDLTIVSFEDRGMSFRRTWVSVFMINNGKEVVSETDEFLVKMSLSPQAERAKNDFLALKNAGVSEENIIGFFEGSLRPEKKKTAPVPDKKEKRPLRAIEF